MTSVVVAGLTGVHLAAIAFLIVSAIGCAAFASRKPKPNPALKPAIDGHWETTPQGTRVWRGASFVRPRAGDPVPEAGAK